MIEGHDPERLTDDEEISLFGVASVLLYHRWRILRWMVVGGALAVIPLLFEGLTYTATASFVPQSAPDPERAGLASLAGQFGLSLGGGGSQAAQSPQFYADLLHSRVILEPIVVDTFRADEGGAAKPLVDLLEIDGASRAQRVERGVNALSDLIGTTIDRETGVLTLSVQSAWPDVSAAIAARLVEGVNAFNLQTRQSQASQERRFTEQRLQDAQSALRKAEDRMETFLQANREFRNSPELVFERDRLQREVMVQQQIVTSLMQSYEEARIREVRDTPVITVIEQPAAATHPNARGRVSRGLLGIFLGAVLGAIAALGADMMRRRRQAGDPDVEAFMTAVGEVKHSLGRLVPRPLRGADRSARPIPAESPDAPAGPRAKAGRGAVPWR